MVSTEDQQWFETQIRENRESMFRIAYAILKNVKDCEDAASAAVLKAYEKLPGLRERDKFRAWILRILKNECYSQLRRRKHEASMPMELEAPAREKDPDLENALFRLSVEERLTILLYYAEGYSVREIAQLLSLREGSVKSRLSRARAKLKKDLREEE